MRKHLFLSRFLALFLALSLSLPGQVLALRNLQPVNSGAEEEVRKKLLEPRAGAEELDWEALGDSKDRVRQTMEYVAQWAGVPVEGLVRLVATGPTGDAGAGGNEFVFWLRERVPVAEAWGFDPTYSNEVLETELHRQVQLSLTDFGSGQKITPQLAKVQFQDPWAQKGIPADHFQFVFSFISLGGEVHLLWQERTQEGAEAVYRGFIENLDQILRSNGLAVLVPGADMKPVESILIPRLEKAGFSVQRGALPSGLAVLLVAKQPLETTRQQIAAKAGTFAGVVANTPPGGRLDQILETWTKGGAVEKLNINTVGSPEELAAYLKGLAVKEPKLAEIKEPDWAVRLSGAILSIRTAGRFEHEENFVGRLINGLKGKIPGITRDRLTVIANHLLFPDSAAAKAAKGPATTPATKNAITPEPKFTRRRFNKWTVFGTLVAVVLGLGYGGYRWATALLPRVFWAMMAHDADGYRRIVERLQSFAGHSPLLYVSEHGPPSLHQLEAENPGVARQLTIAGIDALIQRGEAGVGDTDLGRQLRSILGRSHGAPGDIVADLRAHPEKLRDSQFDRLVGSQAPIFRYLAEHPEIKVESERAPLLSMLYKLRSDLSLRRAMELFLQPGERESYLRAMADYIQYRNRASEERDRAFAQLLRDLLGRAEYRGAGVVIQRGPAHYRVMEYAGDLGDLGFQSEDQRDPVPDPLFELSDAQYAQTLGNGLFTIPASQEMTVIRYAVVGMLSPLLSQGGRTAAEADSLAQTVANTLNPTEIQALRAALGRHEGTFSRLSGGFFGRWSYWVTRVTVAWLTDQRKVPVTVMQNLPQRPNNFQGLTVPGVEAEMQQQLRRLGQPQGALNRPQPALALGVRWDGQMPWQLAGNVPANFFAAGAEEIQIRTLDSNQAFAAIVSSGAQQLVTPQGKFSIEGQKEQISALLQGLSPRIVAFMKQEQIPLLGKDLSQMSFSQWMHDQPWARSQQNSLVLIRVDQRTLMLMRPSDSVPVTLTNHGYKFMKKPDQTAAVWEYRSDQPREAVWISIHPKAAGVKDLFRPSRSGQREQVRLATFGSDSLLVFSQKLWDQFQQEIRSAGGYETEQGKGVLASWKQRLQGLQNSQDRSWFQFYYEKGSQAWFVDSSSADPLQWQVVAVMQVSELIPGSRRARLLIRALPTTHVDRDKIVMEKAQEQGLVLTLPHRFPWMDLREVEPKASPAGNLQELFDRAVQSWDGVAAAPLYAGVTKQILPVFSFEDTFSAIPVAAKAGPFLVLVNSEKKIEAVRRLLEGLSIPPENYQIWKMAGRPAALARAEEFARAANFHIYPVGNPQQQPTWFTDLTSALGEQGTLPFGDFGPAMRATDDYFRFA